MKEKDPRDSKTPQNEDNLSQSKKKGGYGQPPMHTRFRKGRSGNLKGRPPGRHNTRTLMERKLREPKSVRNDHTQVHNQA